MSAKKSARLAPDVQVDHCWSPCCFWVKMLSSAARAWLTSHTPLEPACLLEEEDWKDGAFMVANSIVMDVLAERMKADGLRLKILPLSRELKAWRKQTKEIAENVRAGVLGWYAPEPEPGDTRPRNAFGYLIGFGEAYRRYYEAREKEDKP